MLKVDIKCINIKAVYGAGSVNVGTTLNIVHDQGASDAETTPEIPPKAPFPPAPLTIGSPPVNRLPPFPPDSISPVFRPSPDLI